MEKSPGTPIMITVDIRPVVPKVAANHIVIIKDATTLNCEDLDCKRSLGLIFYDCHNYDAQMKVHHLLLQMKAIRDDTIIALHDTGVWPNQRAGSMQCIHGKQLEGIPGFVHQQETERKMERTFIDMGYNCVNIYPPDVSIFTPEYQKNFPFRHGLTICQNNTRLP